MNTTLGFASCPLILCCEAMQLSSRPTVRIRIRMLVPSSTHNGLRCSLLKRLCSPRDAQDECLTLGTNAPAKFWFVSRHERKSRLGNVYVEFRAEREDAIFKAK